MISQSLQPIEDNFICPDVGAWAENKHRLVSLYATLFSSGMKEKWDQRVYIELYAGAGYARIRGTSKLIAGSPLQALMLKDPFDRYIFCEEIPEKLNALRTRAKRHAPMAPMAPISYIQGDSVAQVAGLLMKFR